MRTSWDSGLGRPNTDVAQSVYQIIALPLVPGGDEGSGPFTVKLQHTIMFQVKPLLLTYD